MLIRLQIVAALVLLFAIPTQAQDATHSEQEFTLNDLPPVKRIVMYNSGVGQLQHEGTVSGDARFKLQFDSNEVSDALRSLVATDDGGGGLYSIEYQTAPDPEDLAAADMGQAMTVTQLLQSLRGEKVVISNNAESFAGTISVLKIELQVTRFAKYWFWSENAA